MRPPTERLLLLLASVAVVLASSLWLASGWVADPPDGTCGSLFRTDLWSDRRDCRRVMLVRAVTAGAIAAAAVAAAVARSRRRYRLANLMAGTAVVASTVALVINEFVRDGGLFT